MAPEDDIIAADPGAGTFDGGDRVEYFVRPAIFLPPGESSQAQRLLKFFFQPGYLSEIRKIYTICSFRGS
jgi:hypothetical protein